MGRRAFLAAMILAALPVGQDELVITIAGTKEYHRPHCDRVRKGGDLLALTIAQANGRGLKPHDACDPSKAPPPGAPPKPIHVFVDGGSDYHRDRCSKLGASPKRVLLEDAAKKLWPCRTCKPPIRPRKKGAEIPNGR